MIQLVHLKILAAKSDALLQ